MANKKKVPELRFKGFTEEWSEQKLGSIAELNPKTDIPEIFEYVDLESVIGTELISHRQEYKKTAPSRAKRHAKKGDLFFQTVRPYQKNNYLYLLPNKNYVFSTGYAQLRPAVDSSFLLGLVQTDQFVNEVLIRCTGTGYPAINSNDLADIIVLYSLSDEEQTKLGTFLMNIDTLITLYQRKYDKLCVFRKAMLEKMFPQEGTDEPEIRFDGFKGKWEIKKLGELYTERNERGNNSLPILSVSIHHGVSDGELDGDMLGKKVRRSEDKSLYKHVYSGDLVFNMMRAWQGAIGVATTEGMVSPAYISAIPNEHVYPQFMDCSLSRDPIILQMNNLSYGVTDFRKRLYWDSFINVLCYIPSIAEQVKISDFFQHLESLISLHQRELDKLKKIKQACLEKMFV